MKFDRVWEIFAGIITLLIAGYVSYQLFFGEIVFVGGRVKLGSYLIGIFTMFCLIGAWNYFKRKEQKKWIKKRF